MRRKSNIKRSLVINVKVYTLGYKQPSATTLTWQMRSLHSERRNANVQLIARSFTVRVSELLSFFKREDGMWASIEIRLVKPHTQIDGKPLRKLDRNHHHIFGPNDMLDEGVRVCLLEHFATPDDPSSRLQNTLDPLKTELASELHFLTYF